MIIMQKLENARSFGSDAPDALQMVLDLSTFSGLSEFKRHVFGLIKSFDLAKTHVLVFSESPFYVAGSAVGLGSERPAIFKRKQVKKVVNDLIGMLREKPNVHIGFSVFEKKNTLKKEQFIKHILFNTGYLLSAKGYVAVPKRNLTLSDFEAAAKQPVNKKMSDRQLETLFEAHSSYWRKFAERRAKLVSRGVEVSEPLNARLAFPRLTTGQGHDLELRVCGDVSEIPTKKENIITIVSASGLDDAAVAKLAEKRKGVFVADFYQGDRRVFIDGQKFSSSSRVENNAKLIEALNKHNIRVHYL